MLAQDVKSALDFYEFVRTDKFQAFFGSRIKSFEDGQELEEKGYFEVEEFISKEIWPRFVQGNGGLRDLKEISDFLDAVDWGQYSEMFRDFWQEVFEELPQLREFGKPGLA